MKKQTCIALSLVAGIALVFHTVTNFAGEKDITPRSAINIREIIILDTSIMIPN